MNRLIRNSLLIGAVLAFSSCAYFEERLDYAGKCANDPACLQMVQEKAAIARALGDASGIPWAGTTAAMVITGLLLAFAKKKKKGE
jgi:hypothetical protein